MIYVHARGAHSPSIRFSLTRLLAMSRKEVLQLRRDPRSLAMAFVIPAFMVVFFGYVISFDVRDIEIAVLDQDGSPQSRALVEAFQAAGRFQVTQHLESPAQIEPLLQGARVRMVLVIPPEFTRDLVAHRPAQLQALVDGADANTASISLNYARAIISSYSAKAVLRSGPVSSPVVPEARVWYNETLETAVMIVPGLVGTIMMIISAMLTALTIAKEWERGTMEQLAATPVSRLEVVLGKLLPYLVIGMIDVTAVTLLGIFMFDVPFRGDVLLFGVMSMLFLLGSLGLGIFISAAVKSQLLATQMAMLATYLPSVLLSGLIFDVRAMPIALQTISRIVPARYFVAVLRGLFLKGVGLSVLWPQGLAMLLYAVIGLTLATRAFKKEIA
jgi:ABC-2 type transport system permease protein